MLNKKRLGVNMKKSFIVLLTLSLLFLTGCTKPVEEKPLIERVKVNLTIDDSIEDITLPTNIGGVIITWQSSIANLITSDGVIIKPLVNTSTTLTATLTHETIVTTKVFEVVVLGNMTSDQNTLQNALDNLTFENFEVIDDIDLISSIFGVNIIWESNNESFITADGTVTRPAEDEEHATVTLKAILSYNDVTIEKIFVFTVINLSQTVVYIGYYAGAEDLTGGDLKSFLHDLIDSHRVVSYGDLWEKLAVSDKDPNNPNNVILFYTGVSISKLDHGGLIGDWNREHVWARSHGDLENYISDSDMHHIRPTDVWMNGKRAALDFDNGGTELYDGSTPTGNYYDSDSWEPRDEVKGDVARMLFYMVIRYEGENPSLDLEINDSVNNINTPYIGKLSVLLEWHIQDPVDDFEMNRNNVIYLYQNNRNPFIDHPEFVEYIFDTN